LGIDGKAFIIQLVTFVIAFWILQRFAFKPILKIMAQRRELIENGVTLGEKMQKDQIALEAKVSEALQAARKEADVVVASAQEASRETIREAETKAHAKADGILAEAKSRTAQDVARARKQLEQELVSLISEATEVIIDEKVDAKKDSALIDKALKNRVAA
jgi:F-type H+-transporting ATPase subunit b